MQSEKGGNDQTIIARLTFTSLLTAVIVVLAAITAAYMFGVMTGRQAARPQKAAAEMQEDAISAPVAEPEAILRPQDLEYAHVLRGEEKPALAQPPEPAQPQPAAGPAPEPAAGEKNGAQVTQVEAPPVPLGLEDFVFQVAALKDQNAADLLREKLEGHGLRTRMERSGKLLLVLVLLRGDQARADETAAIARSLKLGEPLLRSRKPAGQ